MFYKKKMFFPNFVLLLGLVTPYSSLNWAENVAGLG